MEHQPSYIKLYESGVLKARAERAKKSLDQCCLCPHECGVARKTATGFCKASDQAVVSSFGPHFGEEPQLVGTNGSGTVFFGYCNLRCAYCQNYELSFHGEGDLISDEELADIMLKLQNHYLCHNINFVSPTHYVANILNALLIAIEKGLNVPLIYNTGGYEKVEVLKLLDGAIDIYMPDFKYISTEHGRIYSKVKDYPAHVKQALIEMDRQVGGLKSDTKDIAYQGLIIRHLMLPGGLEATKQILEFIAENLSQDCLVNIMDQYYPAHKAFEYEDLSQRVPEDDWDAALDYASKLGLMTV